MTDEQEQAARAELTRATRWFTISGWRDWGAVAIYLAVMLALAALGLNVFLAVIAAVVAQIAWYLTLRLGGWRP